MENESSLEGKKKDVKPGSLNAQNEIKKKKVSPHNFRLDSFLALALGLISSTANKQNPQTNKRTTTTNPRENEQLYLKFCCGN